MSPANGKKAAATETLSLALQEPLQKAVSDACRDWDLGRKTERLWSRDASLWTGGNEGQYLGWLDIVDTQLDDMSKFKALSAEVQEDGFKHFLLMGMGGSSLAPEVFGHTFGKQPGSPELLILDSTDPAQISSIRSKIDPARTLFCVSSKSGTTFEPNLYLQYFFDEARRALGEPAGHHFIAITDLGSKLEGLAEKLGFRRYYQGVPSIGGRYSALSDFGLVPHAAAGLNTEKLLDRAKVMVEACKASEAASNPGVLLGLVMGTAAKTGRDKVTIFTSSSLHSLGAWLEQLLAESTGKQGRGLIPVDREPFAEIEAYGTDRFFAFIKFDGDGETELEKHVQQLEDAGHPVIRISVPDLYDLGQTMFQWEIATAVAGSVISINPFDQPDVEASKAATRQLMDAFEQTGALPQETPLFTQDGFQVFTDPVNLEKLRGGGTTLGAVIRQHMDLIKPGDYFGLLAFIPMFAEYEELLEDIRRHVVESKQVATVLGFGPRFLHSTGQAYKGGPNTGVFLQITSEDPEDVPIPMLPYSFGLVKAAQAQGDFRVLTDRGRQVLRVHLAGDLKKKLHHLRDLICAAVEH